MMYAFSRDRATPGHQLWRRLNHQRVPVYAVWIIAILAFLCAFPAYFGTTASSRTSRSRRSRRSASTSPTRSRSTCACEHGDAWEPGEWNLGKLVPADRHRSRASGSSFIAVLFIMPTSPGGIPCNSGFRWLAVNYAPIAVVGTMLLVGGWWLRLGPEVVHRPDRARATRTSSSAIEEDVRRVRHGARPRAGVDLASDPDARRQPARAGSLARRGSSRADARGAAPAVADGSIDTVVVAFTDMQGRLMGKRLHARLLRRAGRRRPRHRGLQLPARARHGDGPDARATQIASWERGYGDFDLRPDLATLRRIPWLEATALVLCDVAWARRLAGRALAAPGAARAGRAGARARLRADGRLGARVLPAEARRYEEAHAQALPRPDAVGAVHPRLPHPRDDLRRAAASRQIRNGMHGAGHPRSRRSKGEAWPGPAGDQLPLRRRADDGRQPRRLQERREGDRAPERLLDHLHGEARPHAGSAAPATSTRRLWRDGESAFAGESDDVPAVPRRADRVRARARDLPRAERSTRTSASRPARWAPTTLAWGHDNRTCGFRIVGHGRRCASSRGSRAATSTRTSRSRR